MSFPTDTSSNLNRNLGLNLMHEAAVFAQRQEVGARRTQMLAESARPDATKKSYKKPVEEFLKWCEKYQPAPEGYSGNHRVEFTVTETKLNLFLQEDVIGRMSKVKRKGQTEVQPVKYATVNQYVAAITDL